MNACLAHEDKGVNGLSPSHMLTQPDSEVSGYEVKTKEYAVL